MPAPECEERFVAGTLGKSSSVFQFSSPEMAASLPGNASDTLTRPHETGAEGNRSTGGEEGAGPSRECIRVGGGKLGARAPQQQQQQQQHYDHTSPDSSLEVTCSLGSTLDNPKGPQGSNKNTLNAAMGPGQGSLEELSVRGSQGVLVAVSEGLHSGSKGVFGVSSGTVYREP